jgi:hypothetical protein
MPGHLKSKIEQAADYYGITQSEFVKDAIKDALRHHDMAKNLHEVKK